jgi:CHAT domain-containing protein
LDALEKQVTRLGGAEEVRYGFRARHFSYYLDYVDVLMAQKQPELAFQVMERSLARTLLEMLAEAKVDIREGVSPPLLERERSLQRKLEEKSNERMEILEANPNQAQLTAINEEIGNLLNQYREVEEEIRSSSPGYAALTQPPRLSAKEIQQQVLDPDSLLLEYAIGEQRSYLWAVTSGSLSTFELPNRQVIESAARTLYDAMASGRSVQGAAAGLSQVLLGPVADQLGQKRLLIVGLDPLPRIPFAALPDPAKGNRQPLILAHEIVNLPSASTLAVLRLEAGSRAPASKLLAVIADPVYEIDDPRMNSKPVHHAPGRYGHRAARRTARDCEIGFQRLPFSRREGMAVSALVPPGQRLEAYGFAAAVKTVEDPALSQYRYVHIASHSCVDKDRPRLSGIVLSLFDSQGKPQDGFLRLHQVYNLKLRADLVVLSACETAMGKEVRGEGLVGLTRGFMYAGASRVLVSLWRVNDRATAELMRLFYHAMLMDHLRPAAALQAAQIALRKQPRWRSPYYWAPFVLQGESR